MDHRDAPFHIPLLNVNETGTFSGILSTFAYVSRFAMVRHETPGCFLAGLMVKASQVQRTELSNTGKRLVSVRQVLECEAHDGCRTHYGCGVDNGCSGFGHLG